MVLNEYFSRDKWEQPPPPKKTPQTGFVQNFTYDIHQDACSFLCEQQNDARSQNDCNDWGPAATSLFQV